MARLNLFQFLRSTNPATAYPALQPGEVAFNLAKLQAAIGGIDGVTEIFAVRFFSTHSTYAVGDFVVNAGTLLRCITDVTVPGAFNSANWGGAAGGLSDAPSDGSAYSRQDAAWVVITPALVGAPPLNPSDGKYYIRRNAAWAEAVASSIRRGASSTVDADLSAVETTNATQAGQITALQVDVDAKPDDAPNDGQTYGRKNLGWAALVAGSGDVTGPAGALADDIALFNGTTGKLLKAITSLASGRITNASTVVGTTVTDAFNTLAALLATYGTVVTRNTGLAAGNVPVLDGGGKLDSSTMPSIAITDVFVVGSQAAMLALTAQTGDIAIRSDLNKSFALATNSPGTLADWKELLTPTDAVLSVAGLTGVIGAAALRTALTLVVGTDVQAFNARLSALAGLAGGADTLPYSTGATSMGQTALSAYIRGLLAASSAAAARVTLAAEPLGAVNAINTLTASANAAASDAGAVVEMNLAGANTYTIQPNATVAIPVQARIDLVQIGAGQTTIVAGAGVTLRSKSGLKLSGQYSAASLYKRGTDEWVIFGDLTT